LITVLPSADEDDDDEEKGEVEGEFYLAFGWVDGGIVLVMSTMTGPEELPLWGSVPAC